MTESTLPRNLYCGKGTLNTLKNLKGNRAIVALGDCSVRRSGCFEKAVGFLEEAGMDVVSFEISEPNPTMETIITGTEAMRAFEPDWVVSLGGGTPIDTAKVMWALYECPDTTIEKLNAPSVFPKEGTKAKFVAIPSASGTTTGIAEFASITDTQKGKRYPLADFKIVPDIAIFDPELAYTMPKALTAHTGMDVLTHAIEAYLSTLSGPSTDPLALNVIGMVFDNILDAYNGDEKACGYMHYAQSLADMAFPNALLGLVHALSHQTKSVCASVEIPHGCANAIFLPYVIQYNAPVAAKRCAEISQYVGFEGNSDEELTEKLWKSICGLNKSLEIPSKLKDFGISEAEFNEKVSMVAQGVVEDACTGTNPRTATPAQMEELFSCMYHGQTVMID